jgi:hypothetical protein
MELMDSVKRRKRRDATGKKKYEIISTHISALKIFHHNFSRTIFTSYQLDELEKAFKEAHYPGNDLMNTSNYIQ